MLHRRRRPIGPGDKVLLLVGALLVVCLGGGTTAIGYTYLMRHLFNSVAGESVSDLTAADELQTALLNQKGYATYYFLDRDPVWLEQLATHRDAFERCFRSAQAHAKDEAESILLDEIGAGYRQYVKGKEEVIAHYRANHPDIGAELHWPVRKQFFALYGHCEEYRELVKGRIERIHTDAMAKARVFSGLTVAGMVTALLLGVFLVMVLFRYILVPIRQMAREAATHTGEHVHGGGVEALSTGLYRLIGDVDEARTELGRSQERLLQSERMAVLGNLAADVAHTIRNPLTSIKMRLFSLKRSLELTPVQDEDFQVISEEMHRLDNIVSNFLEFSRPPKLKKQTVDLSELIRMTLRLLQHRLELQDIQVERKSEGNIPPIDADPEQLKEALVNIIVNACDAMKEGGTLRVIEEQAVAEGIGQAVLVRFCDTGSGIPEGLSEQVLEPFFSTKEDGTGLGLAIAHRIVSEHGGQIVLRNSGERGATVAITLPVKENGE